MVTIHQGTTGATGQNDWFLTCTESSVLQNPDYIFVLTSQATGATVTFYAQDISSSPAYNRFQISEVAASSVDVQDAKVSLKPQGYWNMVVYETVASVPHNLDINNAIGIVERGIVQVIGSTASLSTPSYAARSLPTPNY